MEIFLLLEFEREKSICETRFLLFLSLSLYNLFYSFALFFFTFIYLVGLKRKIESEMIRLDQEWNRFRNGPLTILFEPVDNFILHQVVNHPGGEN